MPDKPYDLIPEPTVRKALSKVAPQQIYEILIHLPEPHGSLVLWLVDVLVSLAYTRVGLIYPPTPSRAKLIIHRFADFALNFYVNCTLMILML